jgi:hypothetical protein
MSQEKNNIKLAAKASKNLGKALISLKIINATSKKIDDLSQLMQRQVKEIQQELETLNI